MKWEVEFHEEFDAEFDALPEDVQDEIRALAVRSKKSGIGSAGRAPILSRGPVTRI